MTLFERPLLQGYCDYGRSRFDFRKVILNQPNLEDAKSNASLGNVTIPVRRAVAHVVYIQFSGPISGIV